MSIAPMYYVQTCTFEVITFLLLLAAASTSLAQLFIPRGQRQPHHLPILRMVAIADVMQLISQLDPYAVFGIYSTALAHLLQIQVTSIIFYLCAYSLYHNFVTLYQLLQRPPPWYLPWLLWPLPTLHHLIRTGSTFVEFTIDLSTASASFLSRFIMIRSITFICTSGVLIVLSLVLVTWLALTIRSFIERLEHMRKREIDAAKSATTLIEISEKNAFANGHPNDRPVSPPAKPIYNTLVISGIQTRISTMRFAKRRVVLGTLGINAVLITAFAVNASRLTDIANHSLGRGEFVVTDSSVWVWRGISVHVLQMVSLTLFTWYTWRSPLLWVRSPYSFMSTLSFGVEYAAAQAAAQVSQDPNALYASQDVVKSKNAGVVKMFMDANTSSTDSGENAPSPFETPLTTAREDKIVVVCHSPKNENDPHTHITDLICPGTVQSTTRQIPVPPFNSMVEERTLVKLDSHLSPIDEKQRYHVGDLELGFQNSAVLIGESKLLANLTNPEEDRSCIDQSAATQVS